MRWLPLIFLLAIVVVPAVEIATFIEVGGRIGALPTILLTIFTAVLGVYLVRLQGFFALADFQRAMAEGRAPFVEMLAGALLLLAGICLLIPGFVTDAIGFLLLIPPLRRVLARLLANALFRPLPATRPGAGVIEVEVVEVRDAERPDDGPPPTLPRR
jgi:UPF0716 protein FxsA